MSMSKGRSERQEDVWVNTSRIFTSSSPPFYSRVHRFPDEHSFERSVENRRREFLRGKSGRVPPLIAGRSSRAAIQRLCGPRRDDISARHRLRVFPSDVDRHGA